MFCPKCRAEYMSHVSACVPCQTPLVKTLSASTNVDSQEAMAEALVDCELQAIVVGRLTDVLEAQGILAKEGLPSLIAPEDQSQQVLGNEDRLFLLVNADHLDRVRLAFQNRWEKGLSIEGLMFASDQDNKSVHSLVELAVSECPACGTSLSLAQEECLECGLYIGMMEEKG
jgi:hypothetical protein